MVKKALLVLLVVMIFSSPWYLYNLSRQSSAFASLSELPFPNVPKVGLSLSGLKSFFSPFFFTLFRGEFVWNGTHFHALSPKAQYYLLNLIPWFFVLLGFASFFVPVDRENPILFRFLIFSAGMGFLAFYSVQVFIGHAAFYQSRYAFGALYVLVFVFVAGWKRLSPSKEAVLFVPLLGLVIHHIVYTYALLTRVF